MSFKVHTVSISSVNIEFDADAEGKTETSVEKMTIAATGHKWDKGTVTNAAAATKKGVKTYTCTVCGTTKTVTIPATITVDGVTYKVTAIANSAFQGNKTITKVTIPKNVTTIGTYQCDI